MKSLPKNIGIRSPNLTKGADMARPWRVFFPGSFYHLTTRVNACKAVFKSKRDMQKLSAPSLLEVSRLSIS